MVEMSGDIALWTGFALLIVAMLAVDLGVFHRKAHVIRMREAVTWTGVWIGLALAFTLVLFVLQGSGAALQFFTGYLVEKSLSIDNVFVFVLIFSYFNTPRPYQHKVLFWGIVGALIARAVFVVTGLAILEAVRGAIYVFGSFLLGTGIWMMFRPHKEYDPSHNPIIRLFRRYAPVTERYEGSKFFIRRDGRYWATPLFVVLLAVESSDIVFAVDSIPAIFAITQDHFIVYSSNVFAMLGLRAMYFAVAGFMQSFHYLHYAFASIITILGIKMLVSEVFHLPVAASLGLIVVILMAAVIASLLRPRRQDLRSLFRRFEHRGLIPLRGLLELENIVDLWERQVGQAMLPREKVAVVRADAPWRENWETLTGTKRSRFPLVAADGRPLGIIHVKDLLYSGRQPVSSDEWKTLAKPALMAPDDALLDDLLVKLQRERLHMALVHNAKGEWTGLITLEDLIEEIIGSVSDEFDVVVADGMGLAPERVVLDLSAESVDDAIRQILDHVPPTALADDRSRIATFLVRNAKRSLRTQGGVAVVQGPLSAREPLLLFGRSDAGVPAPDGTSRVQALFVLLTPAGQGSGREALARLTEMIGSEAVRERLFHAESVSEVIEVVREAGLVATG